MDLDPHFSAALRSELVRRATPRTRWWRRRAALLSLGLAVGGGLVGGSVAIAEVAGPPGGRDREPVAAEVTRHGIGTASLELGARPAGATAIWLEVTCESPGTFGLDGQGSLECQSGELVSPAGIEVPLTPGKRTVTITAGAAERWSATARYVAAKTTEWGVNDAGATFGALNELGAPDLIAVVATNGLDGYVYRRDLDAAEGPEPTSPADAIRSHEPASPVPVYASDGVTRIGSFELPPAPWTP